MEMTIKQLADELGVSKPTIRNIVSELGIQSKLRKVGNRYMLSDAQITQVKLQILKDGVLSESEKTEKSESEVLSESEKTEKSESEMLSESEKTENSIVREQLSILSQQLTVKDNQIQVLNTSATRSTYCQRQPDSNIARADWTTYGCHGEYGSRFDRCAGTPCRNYSKTADRT